MRTLNIFIPHCSDLLTDHRPHGDGLVANGFIRHLAERGHNLYVAAERVDVRHPFPSNVRLHSLQQKSGPLARLAYMARMRRLYRHYSRTVRFDVIHQLNPVFTGMSLALVGAQPPLVLGPYVARWPNDPDAAGASVKPLAHLLTSLRAGIARRQQAHASILLLTTPAAVDRIPAYEVLAARTRMLPHGLDTNLFVPPEPSPSVRDATSTLDILFLSNIVERKGIFDLLEAFASIASDFPAARLLVAGDGPELPRSKAVVAEMPVRGQVVFLGRQTREQSLRLLQQCTVFCQPSLGEPFGMSAAEAMSCGKPLVVTDAGGLGYLVDDAGGLRVPPASPVALAAALKRLLSDADLREKMGRYNRQRMVEWMSWQAVIGRLETIYEDVLNSARPGAVDRGTT